MNANHIQRIQIIASRDCSCTLTCIYTCHCHISNLLNTSYAALICSSGPCKAYLSAMAADKVLWSQPGFVPEVAAPTVYSKAGGGLSYADRIGSTLHHCSDEASPLQPAILQREVMRQTGGKDVGGSAPGLTARCDPLRAAFTSGCYVKDSGLYYFSLIECDIPWEPIS